MRKIILASVFFVLTSTVYGGEGEGEGDDETTPPNIEYVSLGSKLVVNLQGRRKYFRADMQLMVEGEDNVEKISLHNPAIQHALIALFSQYTAEQLVGPKQREVVRKLALEEIRKTLEKYSNSKGIKDLFFTEFLIH